MPVVGRCGNRFLQDRCMHEHVGVLRTSGMILGEIAHVLPVLSGHQPSLLQPCRNPLD